MAIIFLTDIYRLYVVTNPGLIDKTNDLHKKIFRKNLLKSLATLIYTMYIIALQHKTQGEKMKTVGDKIEEFAITGINPGRDDFFTITNKSFESKWKVIVYYPKSFTFVCPTEIVAYDKLNQDFEDRDAVLLTGSTDNEFCALAWQKDHPDLAKIRHIQFADTQRGELSLVEQLGVFYGPAGAPLRATFIVDPDNVIQHVSVNNLNVGRNPEETLRILDGLQTNELCACNRKIGGETL